MMTEKTDVTRTIEVLGSAVNEELDDKYTLVYTEHDQTLPAAVVAALVNGDNPWETNDGDRLMEWAGEVARNAARDAVDELANDIVSRWEREDDNDYEYSLYAEWPLTAEQQAAIETVQDRDTSTWFDDLIARHGPVLLRVPIASMDEDAGLSFTPMTHAEFLDRLGFAHTGDNLRIAAEVVDNASPEHSVAIGYALIGVDLASITTLPTDGKVELRNPHVWLGNPFAGTGWCSEEPFTGTLTVDRDDLRTDDDAFGRSWSEVVGGTSASFFAGEIAADKAPMCAACGGPIHNPTWGCIRPVQE